ncbi:unnamed protein product, partial [Pylaiella littoralis]
QQPFFRIKTYEPGGVEAAVAVRQNKQVSPLRRVYRSQLRKARRNTKGRQEKKSIKKGTSGRGSYSSGARQVQTAPTKGGPRK